MSDLVTLTSRATEAAIQSSARYTEIQQSMISDGDWTALLQDVWSRPGAPADDAGWSCEDTVSALVRVVYHVDPQRRTVYLVIDRDKAPKTGTYRVQINSVSMSYNATTEAPSDVDELLQGIADAINSDTSMSSLVSADVYSMGGADDDAIRLRAVVTDTTTLNSYTVGANTTFPSAAELELVREVSSASVRLWGRAASTVQDSIELGGPCGDMASAWVPMLDLGEQEDGLQQQVDAAACAAMWVELYDVTTPADAYTGTITDWACASVAVATTGPS